MSSIRRPSGSISRIGDIQPLYPTVVSYEGVIQKPGAPNRHPKTGQFVSTRRTKKGGRK